jgi:DNA-binding LytR/AlgR family response regulator
MLKITICDDEECLRKEIIRNCREYEKHNKYLSLNYIEFSNGEDLIAYNLQIDILFLDIKLPGINGIEAMRQLESNDAIGIIVFVTGYTKYIWDSFSRKTLGYLVKPIKYPKFALCFNKVLNGIKRNVPIDIQIGDNTISISSNSLQYIEAQGCYSMLVSNNENYLVRVTLKEWEERLRQYGFLRIHKSFLVNISYIRNINKYVVLDNGVKLKISRSKKTELKEIFKNYSKRNSR